MKGASRTAPNNGFTLRSLRSLALRGTIFIGGDERHRSNAAVVPWCAVAAAPGHAPAAHVVNPETLDAIIPFRFSYALVDDPRCRRMTISARARKLLWGKAGMRCALCRQALLIEGENPDPDSIIGEECHIVSASPGGPRHGPEPGCGYDHYDNLVLLCRVDHKWVDDQPAYFSAERLAAVKLAHEAWVASSLTSEPKGSISSSEGDRKYRLSRATTGSFLLGVVGGVHGYDMDSDQLQSQSEVEFVGGFLQHLHDLGEQFDDLESGDRVRVRYQLDRSIAELESMGFLVYAAQSSREILPGTNGRIATVRVVRLTNPDVWDPEIMNRFIESLRSTEAHD